MLGKAVINNLKNVCWLQDHKYSLRCRATDILKIFLDESEKIGGSTQVIQTYELILRGGGRGEHLSQT
jgi:hypothetical protein